MSRQNNARVVCMYVCWWKDPRSKIEYSKLAQGLKGSRVQRCCSKTDKEGRNVARLLFLLEGRTRTLVEEKPRLEIMIGRCVWAWQSSGDIELLWWK